MKTRDGSRAEAMLCKIERGVYRGRCKGSKAWRRAAQQATREDRWWGFGPHGVGVDHARRWF